MVRPRLASVAALLALTACSSDPPVTAATSAAGAAGSSGAGGASFAGAGGSSGTSGHGGAAAGSAGAGGAVPQAAFNVRGSVEQVMVWKATPMSTIELHDSTGALVASGTTDTLGSYIFRKVTPGDGYSVQEPTLTPPAVVQPITVWSIENSQPATSFYTSQSLTKGSGYITTRDGTKLAIYVTMPGDPDKGPYPTVVNYSGYNPAQPGAPIAHEAPLCPSYPVLCDAPTDPSALISALMGYATVSVNMRGTGCSGGAYDYFEDLQLLDGYDVIETAAAQPWVLHNKVGMTGLSYPGITQLFVAKTHPPSLAAITPLSVIGGTYSTARPGGIFNKGFALEWITDVVDKADPYGQGWEQAQVDAGDTICQDNQLLHGQKANVVQEAQDTPYYTDDLVGRVDPTTFVSTINVPVFLAGAWQDEQTGPFFFTLLDQFTNAPVKRFSTYNGVHVDGFAPQILVEWKTFLDLYVAQRVPSIDDGIRGLAPQLFQQIFKSNLQLPPDRFASYATWEEAKAAYEAEVPLRALFEDGANSADDPGAPVATFEMPFASFPPSTTTPLRYYFQPDGSLGDAAPTATEGAASFALDLGAGDRGILAPNGDVWDLLPDYAWPALPAGNDAVWVSPPLTSDLVMLGSASADLWLRSPVDDADLEVNLTEVRPDGQEMYVQSGWLRASLRSLATTATELRPDHTYRQEDEALLVPGEWNQARVGFAGFSHVFRTGSRIAIMVDTPGDSRAAWRFDLKTFPNPVSYDIGASSTHSSSVVFPVLGGVTATTPLPNCPSLRGQPCRPFVPYTNTPSSP